jgi:hypothetical protein
MEIFAGHKRKFGFSAEKLVEQYFTATIINICNRLHLDLMQTKINGKIIPQTVFEF